MRVFKGELRDSVDLLAFGPGERLAAASSGRERVDVWDAVTGHQADAWLARGQSVTDLGFLPDGRVLACVKNHPLQVIDPDSPEKGGRIFPTYANFDLSRVAVRVATAGDRVFTINLDDSASQNASENLLAHSGAPAWIPAFTCWQPRGSGSYEVTWTEPLGHSPTAIAASPDGSLVAFLQQVGDVPLLVIRDGHTGNEIRRITTGFHRWGDRNRLRFTPDGVRLFAIRDDAVNVWDCSTGKPVGRLSLPGRPWVITDVAIHPSGRWLLTSGADGRVGVWDADRLTEVTALQWDVGPLRSIAIGAEGTLAATGCESGRIVVWDLDL